MMFDSLLDWFNFIAFDRAFDIFDDLSKVQKNPVSGLRILVLFQNHSAFFLRYSKDSARNSPEKSETLIILTLN